MKKAKFSLKLHKPQLKKLLWQLNPRRWKKRTRLLVLANTLLLIGFIICLISYHSTANLLYSQQAAERWTGTSELKFSQLSVFINNEDIVTEEALFDFGQQVDSALLAASLTAAENGSLWTAGYLGTTTLSVSASRGSATATAFGVGGNFFFFHPLRLRDGSYFSSDYLMDDLVVIDEELAWKLYGGIELAGMDLVINDTSFKIAGVIAREDDRYSSRVYSGEPRIYLSYSALNKLQETPISCYEIVLASPVSGFGANVLNEHFPVGENSIILENSGRFGAEAIIKVLLNFGERTIHDKALAYPYWENAARLAENQLALTVLIAFILLLLPSGTLVYLIIKEIKHVQHRIKKRRQGVRQ